MHYTALLAVAIFSTATSAVSPIVDLGYSKYQGTPLQNGITQWLGIRFAAAPLGNLRFRAPQDPVNITELQLADNVYSIVAFLLVPFQ
jgi:carboxylesterase type B